MAALIYIFVAVFGLAFGWLIGMNGAMWNGVPVTFVCAVLAFGINWIVFVPAWIGKTEKYFDLTGSLTYLSVTFCAMVMIGTPSLIDWAVAAMVSIWCLRLGSMLFARITRDGEDKRFRAIKTNFVRFLGTWTTQGLWVVITMACVLVIWTNPTERELDLFFISGAVVWGVGFLCEVIADNQKNAFRANPENQGKFISTGLWAWSQHPNYFGEILLWTGIAIIALPELSGFGWAALVSPVFVFVLLTRVSGMRMLDYMAEKRWGSDEAYQAYRSRTSKLIPLPPRQ